MIIRYILLDEYFTKLICFFFFEKYTYMHNKQWSMAQTPIIKYKMKQICLSKLHNTAL